MLGGRRTAVIGKVAFCTAELGIYNENPPCPAALCTSHTLNCK